MKEMRDVVIVGYLRTAQSRSRPNEPERDVFYKLRADDLLARLLPEVLKRSGVKPEEVDDFLVGSAVGVNENWTYGITKNFTFGFVCYKLLVISLFIWLKVNSPKD